MSKSRVSEKGQVVIPKEIRDELGLARGMILEVEVEGGNVVLKPAQWPPEEIFVEAGPGVTEPVVGEAKEGGDKAERLLRDMGAR